MRTPRPAWGSLHAVIPLAAALHVAAHLGAPSDGWRQLAEGMSSLVIIAAMAFWVRGNRPALACGEAASEVRESLRVTVAYSPQPVPRREVGLAGVQRN